MGVKSVVLKQYRDFINRAVVHSNLVLPNEGWIHVVRSALGMSSAQLAKRLGVTRARIYQAEKNELNGSITLNSMQNIAAGLGCKFVYAIVPEQNIENIVYARALEIAKKLVAKVSVHMAMEDQTLANEKIAAEVERVAAQILQEMPRSLWDE